MVGDSGEATTESSLSMMREADHIFTLWCSGRSYMEGMLVTLKMIKRQDVFSQVNQKVSSNHFHENIFFNIFVVRYTINRQNDCENNFG